MNRMNEPESILMNKTGGNHNSDETIFSLSKGTKNDYPELPIIHHQRIINHCRLSPPAAVAALGVNGLASRRAWYE